METSNKATLIFEIPDNFSNPGAIIDLRFMERLCSPPFGVSNNGAPITTEVSSQMSSWYKKIQTQSHVYFKLIEQAKNLENHKRKERGQKALNDFQAMLSLLGIDPDQSYSKDFCLLEALAISYALRQGVFTSDELKRHRKATRADIGILTDDLVKDAAASVNKLTSKIKSRKQGAPSTDNAEA